MDNMIYAANSADQPFDTAGYVNFGSIVRKKGCDLTLSGGNVVARAKDHYGVQILLNVLGSTTGTLVVQVYSDGVPIPGAKASITTAASVYTNVTIPTAIKDECCSERTITCQVSGVAVDIVNASILVFD